MSGGKETLQSIAPDDQAALIARDQMIALELDEELGYAWTRSTYQISQVLVSRGHREARPTLVFDAEIRT